MKRINSRKKVLKKKLKNYNSELDNMLNEVLKVNELINLTQTSINELELIDYDTEDSEDSEDSNESIELNVFGDNDVSEEINFDNDITIEGYEELNEELKSNMNKNDSDKFERYLAAANLIQDSIPEREVFVDISQTVNGSQGLSHDMSLKANTESGPKNILSPKEKEEIDSGKLTLESLVRIVNSFK